MSFAEYPRLTKFLVITGGIVLTIQLIGSIWSLVQRWDDDFGYAQESMTTNRGFYERFWELASTTQNQSEANRAWDKLQIESQARSTEDEKRDFSEVEKRMGMRAGLRQTQRPCAQCNIVPADMTPTNCAVCGNFTIPRF